MKKTSKLFMAFGAGKESTEGAIIKKYIGIAPVYVLAVNPVKTQLEAIYGRTLENSPEYLGSVEVDGKKVDQVRIDFIVSTNKDGMEVNPIDMTTKISFFVRNMPFVGSTSGKVQIIDKYGRTAWATQEDINTKSIPQYKNGPANIDSDYRVAYRGEAELTDFIRTYLNIPDVMNYVNNIWVMSSTPEESEARLDKIANYFKNDFSELSEICSLQPNNKIKCMFGVRTTEKGEFQTVYTRKFYKNNATNYSKLDAEYKESKASGSFTDTEFDTCDLKEYQVVTTDFSSSTSTESPFGGGSDGSPWGFNQ